MKDSALQISQFLSLVTKQLQAQPPVMLFVAAVWFGLVALLLPWLLRLLLLISPALSGVFAVWALIHLLLGVLKLATGLRRLSR